MHQEISNFLLDHFDFLYTALSKTPPKSGVFDLKCSVWLFCAGQTLVFPQSEDLAMTFSWNDSLLTWSTV